ncbi:MAG TPA: ABC transporter permease [Gemmatimonadota bacterium]|nr:ABC transporter permease [Gemmatimonadota bacterium]
MTGYLLKRILQSVPILLGASTIIFFLMHAAPGDPTSIYLGNPNIDPAVIEQMRRNLGLDQPVHIQYVKWISSFLTGEFGYSFSQHRPISEILKDAIPNTLLLSAVALLIIFLIGVVIGTVQAVRQYSWIDNTATIASFFLYSMPSFWFGLMLILLFGYKLQWLPASQMTAVNYDFLSPSDQIVDRLKHLLLPAVALGFGGAAAVARYMRSGMLEQIRQDYVRTARAKGLGEGVVVFKHALRNALIPVVTLLGLYIPFLMSGAVLIETIFAWPGMGRTIVTAIFQRDYPVVLASAFVISIMVILGNLLSDVLYSVVDPRVTVEEEAA